ncbi:MAG: hypothetical protein ACKV2V_24150 [Blastocatellia bacterium]
MFSFLSNFKHNQEMRESKDEILIGEIVRAMARLQAPANGFIAGTGQQTVRFKPLEDATLHSVMITLDRKTGGSALQQALVGSKATITVQAEVKNYLADPDDLVHMYRTDIANIFKIPMLGDVRLDHQLNSILATKKTLIDIDDYILKGEDGARALSGFLQGLIADLRQKLAPYKKA